MTIHEKQTFLRIPVETYSVERGTYAVTAHDPYGELCAGQEITAYAQVTDPDTVTLIGTSDYAHRVVYKKQEINRLNLTITPEKGQARPFVKKRLVWAAE